MLMLVNKNTTSYLLLVNASSVPLIILKDTTFDFNNAPVNVEINSN